MPSVHTSGSASTNPLPRPPNYWSVPDSTLHVSQPYTFPAPPPLNYAVESTSSSTDKILARQVHGRDLPAFSGQPEEWPAFFLALETSTKFCQFSPAENLIRLQRCLKGEALKMVKCLLVSPDSVPIVIEQLRMRFGRPDQIIKNLITKARLLPSVRMDKLDSLIELGVAVNNLTATIMSLKCPTYLYNSILIEELVQKLPNAHQLDWARHFQSSGRDAPTVDLFAEWLHTIMNAACFLCPPKMSKEESSHGRRRTPNDRVLIADEERKRSDEGRGDRRHQDRRPPPKCLCCKAPNHKLFACQTFTRKTVQERWDMVKEKKLCFRCLNAGHETRECRYRGTCGMDGCSKPHHKLLHDPRLQRRPLQQEERGHQQVPPSPPAEVVTTMEEFPYINLMVLPVRLEGPSKSINTFAMLDCGSTLTVIESTIAETLGLEGEARQITVGGFQSDPTLINTKVVALKIKSRDGSFSCDLKNVKAMDKLMLREQSVRKSLLQKWSHLRDIDIATFDCKRPGILIGMDNPKLFLQQDCRVRRGSNGNSPVAIRTPLGWTLMGRTSWSGREQYGYHVHEVDPLHQLVKDQFATDALGVKLLVEKPRSTEDKRAQDILDTSTHRVEGGWETALLWRDDNVRLPDSYANAYRRLLSMEKIMDKDPCFQDSYCAKIAEYLEKGFARVLTPEEAAVTTPKTNYVPHFMAYNPKKPGKLRFVFDAAARNHGQSLNDHLLPGPDKLIPLPNILLKFRQRKIGLTADIDMFHRVKVKQDDAQAQRFLWRGRDRTRPPDVMEMGVLIFGATCSPTCAQEAKNRNAAEFQQQFPHAYDAIVNRHYVDDLLDCCDTVEEAKKRFEEVRAIQAAGGFNLRNWLSNSPELVTYIPENLRAKNMKDLQMGEDNII